jgi:hypothetical protein
VPLRRRLRWAERFSDKATLRGLFIVKILDARSSALLSRVTLWDQFLAVDLRALLDRFAARFMRIGLRT